MDIKSIRPWRLALDQVGPFRDPIEEIHFEDRHHTLANLFMLAARNGRGKTTALEAIAYLFSMLSEGFDEQTALHHSIAQERAARLQLDCFVELVSEQADETYLLSLSFGLEGSSELFQSKDLSLTSIYALTNGRAEKRLRIGFVNESNAARLRPAKFLHSPSQEGMSSHALEREAIECQKLVTELRQFIATPSLQEAYSSFEAGRTLDGRPTLLYFTAHRDVIASPRDDIKLTEPELPEYRPVQPFGQEGIQWANSLLFPHQDPGLRNCTIG